MLRATLLLHRKRVYDDGTIVEIKLWRVPGPVRGSSHLFKYSLFFGGDVERLVGYDNEPGKGDHRHYGDVEEVYKFTTPEQLVANFLADVRKTRRRRMH
jgi:Family of unknown function (DUF6516)